MGDQLEAFFSFFFSFFHCKAHSTDPYIIMIPPPVVQRGLFTLDRSLFKKTVSVMALRIPANLTMECKKAIGTYELLSGRFSSLTQIVILAERDGQLPISQARRLKVAQILRIGVFVHLNPCWIESDVSCFSSSPLGTCSWSPRSGTLSTAMMVKSPSDWFF